MPFIGPFLSVAVATVTGWFRSRSESVRRTVDRVDRSSMMIAIAATIVVVTVAAGIGIAVRYKMGSIRDTAIAERDAHWKGKLAVERNVVLARQMARDRATADAAAAERLQIARERDEAQARAKHASDALAAIEAARAQRNVARVASGRKPVAIDPVVWPRRLAKALK
jgi:hypothetical protein